MRRGIRFSGERAENRFRSKGASIRKGWGGWRERISLGNWVRYLYRQPMIPTGHVGRRMFVGWRLGPVAGHRFLNRILIGDL